MVTKVFVYGSLMSGFQNHGLLEGARFLCEARTVDPYTMYSLGTYPAVTPEPLTTVVGEVYEVDDETLAGLDKLEGHPRFYRRELVYVQGPRGLTRAEMYLLPAENRPRAWRKAVVLSGSWRSYTREEML